MLEVKYVVEDLAKNVHKRGTSKFNVTNRFLAFLKNGLTLAFI